LAEHDERAVPGFTTSTKTRPLIVAKLEEYIRNKLINIHSSRVFHELKTFVWVNGKPQAMRSYNDDLVINSSIISLLRLGIDSAPPYWYLAVKYAFLYLSWVFQAGSRQAGSHQSAISFVQLAFS